MTMIRSILLCRIVLATCILFCSSYRYLTQTPFVAAAGSMIRNAHVRSLQATEEAPFLSYMPTTAVTDHSMIDLDQRAIEARLALETDDGMEQARKIYMEGAFSKSYANLTLAEALTENIPAGTAVVGRNVNAAQVTGKTMVDANTGDVFLIVQYDVDNFSDDKHCFVGGNPNPDTTGCFRLYGSVLIGDNANLEHSYSYDPLVENRNDRTLHSLSSRAQEKLYECDRCPYPMYEMFYRFYGKFDYANEWIMAAIRGTATSLNGGNADFNKLGLEGRGEAVRVGTVVLNLWMWVTRELNHAIDVCETNCPGPDCTDGKAHSWDEAVALYTGSVARSTGTNGYLLYTLAEEECREFGTCNSDGMAQVNQEIFRNFQSGKTSLLQGDCAKARAEAQKIVALMTVPLVQGTLRIAYALDVQQNNQEITQARGAAFAAAVLPILDNCSSLRAVTVYNDLQVGKGTQSSYEVIKDALESQYGCMQITCAQVGGLLDPAGSGYMAGAEPCDTQSTSFPGAESPTAAPNANPNSSSSSDSKAGLIIGMIVVVGFFAGIGACARGKMESKEFDSANGGGGGSSNQPEAAAAPESNTDEGGLT